MARNKHPEETVRRILEVSYRLFLEKGYDHTTVQDIVSALGMSKGAVYHHFKSKEDIIDKLTSRYYDDINWFEDYCRMEGLTGLGKLRAILIQQLSDPRKLEMDSVVVSLKQNPRLLLMTLESTMGEASQCVTQLMEEGVRDGSIVTEYPRQLSEVFMLLFNIWIGVCTQTREDFLGKLAFLKEMTDRMGLPIVDEEILQVATDYYDQIMAKGLKALMGR